MPGPASARLYSTDLAITTEIDLYARAGDGRLSPEALDVLLSLYAHPVDLNRDGRDALFDLPGLTWAMVDDIIALRGRSGGLRRLEDLLTVSGITPGLLEQLRPFAWAEPLKQASKATLLTGRAIVGALGRMGAGRNAASIDDAAERLGGLQGYSRFQVRRGAWEGGGLVTWRRRMAVAYDRGRGALVSEGPREAFDWDHGYVRWRPSWGQLLFGSYRAGFGERLVFASTARSRPAGAYPQAQVQVDMSGGGVQPQSAQWGAAVTWDPQPATRFRATGFVSSASRDLYQYDVRYGPDRWHGVAVCDTDGDCPRGFSCGETRVCRSSAVYQRFSVQAPSYRFETHRDVMRETLGGVHLEYGGSAGHALGATAYWGTVDWQLPPDLAPRFAPSARWSNRPWFGAGGVHGRLVFDRGEAAVAWARTFNGGHALRARGQLRLGANWRLSGAGWRYDRRFDNPYARPEAAPDETLGTRARNELGFRVQSVWDLARAWRGVSRLTVWRPLAVRVIEGAQPRWVAWRARGWSLAAEQRWWYRPGTALGLGLTLRFTDRDLNHSGRDERYAPDSTAFEVSRVRAQETAELRRCGLPQGLASATADVASLVNAHYRGACGRVWGRGERWRGGFEARWHPGAGFTLRGAYSLALEDRAGSRDRFDVQHRWRVQGAWTGRTGTQVVASGAWWRREHAGDRPSDREHPRLEVGLALRRSLGDRFRVQARYRGMGYRDERPERFPWYHTGLVAVEVLWPTTGL